jgi:hypothetical protein
VSKQVHIVKSSCRRTAALVAMLVISPCMAAAQTEPALSGVWVLDSTGEATGDAYGEVRIVRQGDDGLRLSMIDYGTAWVGGAFRNVVRVMPWTFRYDSWGPRRGGSTSSQPRTKARWNGGTLVLGKLTERGTGDFVWLWNLSEDARRLTQRQGAASWSEVTHETVVQGESLSFLRASHEDAATSSLPSLMDRLRAVLPAAGEILVRVNIDEASVTVSCPAHDCKIVQFQFGRQTGARALRRGEPLALSIDAEIRVEPLP